MKIKNKNLNKLILFFLLLFILSTSVHAQISDGLRRINDFFVNEEFRTYSIIIDFLLFFTIALSTMIIGVKAVFPERRQGTAIAVVFALIATIGLVRAGVSIINLIPYVGVIVFIGIVIIIFFLLNGLGVLKEKKFAVFLLSLFIAFILFILFGWASYYGFDLLNLKLS